MLLDDTRSSSTDEIDLGAIGSGSRARAAVRPAPLPRWTVVLPFHNERDYLHISLRSLGSQTERFSLILVDNGSTDGSGDIALSFCREMGIDATLLREGRPGKVAALQCGIAAARTELIATCDADTSYPSDYLDRATRLLDRRDVVTAIACTSSPGTSAFGRKIAGWRMMLTARLLRQQCHNGGAGQVFRADALRAAGGFDPAIWNWVLEDHEIMARIEQEGVIAYHQDFHCAPSTRPRSGNCTGWKLVEQLRYHVTSSAGRVAFFHDFLGPKLRQRALTSDRLRRDARHSEEPRGLTNLHPLRG